MAKSTDTDLLEDESCGDVADNPMDSRIEGYIPSAILQPDETQDLPPALPAPANPSLAENESNIFSGDTLFLPTIVPAHDVLAAPDAPPAHTLPIVNATPARTPVGEKKSKSTKFGQEQEFFKS